jgi:hypothetical protein
MRIRFAHPDDFAAIATFYRETRYAGGLDAADRVVLLERGHRIAGPIAWLGKTGCWFCAGCVSRQGCAVRGSAGGC